VRIAIEKEVMARFLHILIIPTAAKSSNQRVHQREKDGRRRRSKEENDGTMIKVLMAGYFILKVGRLQNEYNSMHGETLSYSI